MKIKLTFWKAVFIVINDPGPVLLFHSLFPWSGRGFDMSDQFPWGLWIGFDCLCGVMLAAGGSALSAPSTYSTSSACIA